MQGHVAFLQHGVPVQCSPAAGMRVNPAERCLQDAIELLIEVGDAHPKFLRKNLAEVVDAMLQVGRVGGPPPPGGGGAAGRGGASCTGGRGSSNSSACTMLLGVQPGLLLGTARPQVAGVAHLEDATRSLAAEFLITLAEARDKVGGQGHAPVRWMELLQSRRALLALTSASRRRGGLPNERKNQSHTHSL